MNSTELIKASETDYKMLKEKGKVGEEVLHYNGFLDGYGFGLADGMAIANKVKEAFTQRLDHELTHGFISYEQYLSLKIELDKIA